VNPSRHDDAQTSACALSWQLEPTTKEQAMSKDRNGRELRSLGTAELIEMYHEYYDQAVGDLRDEFEEILLDRAERGDSAAERWSEMQ
jgi:hypothetical protein